MTETIKSNHVKMAARISGLLLVIALLVASLPLSGDAFAMQSCSRSHTVEAGDTLSAIAVEYSTTVQELATLNNLTDPYTLTVGQVVCLPGAAATATPTGSSASSSSSSSDKDAPSFSVVDNGGKIDVVVSPTSVRGNYVVRVAERGFAPKYYKVGVLKTNKEATITRRYRIPDSLIDTDITVCLKNVRTDKVYCRSVFR